MIYLIGGASRAGKSILGRRVAKHFGASYLPLDSLFFAMEHGFPAAGVRINQRDAIKATKMWPFQKNIIEYVMSKDLDYVFEGVTLMPARVRLFCDEHLGKVKSIFIGYGNTTVPNKLGAMRKSDTSVTDWLLKRDEETQQKHIHNNINRSKRFAAQCKHHNIPYFDTSPDFHAAHNQAFAYLTGDSHAR